MMGRYEYAVVPLGDEVYLEDARQALGDLFHNCEHVRPT